MNKLLLPLLLLPFLLHAQDIQRYQKEVETIQKNNDSIWDATRPTLVFTGSSSVRMWKDVQQRFPQYQILNNGFGGSQFSDLQHYLDELILNYEPVKVFIYEGDNDISAKKRPRAILKLSKEILQTLQQERPQMEIVLISAKPSLSRWHLRRKYKRLNRKLSRLAKKTNGIEFVDVWTPMLNNKKVMDDIFIEDGLHMNKKGYDIWQQTLKDYINLNTNLN
ncbi:SGNH/GDSL hydrolase family protein [Flagellimonas sp.]|uniref:SGNH/GDSL hydrolase family protein n=1 Tax=Flagellimonas sp. TaxID=2058762 RepID=UPI003BA90720